MTSRTHYVPPEVELFIEANNLDAVDNGKATRRACRSAFARWPTHVRGNAQKVARRIYQVTQGNVIIEPDYIPGYDDGCEPPEGRNQD